MKRTQLLLAVASAPTGCGSMIQAVNAYGGVAVSDLKAANDSFVPGGTAAACGTSVGAAYWIPQVIPKYLRASTKLARPNSVNKLSVVIGQPAVACLEKFE